MAFWKGLFMASLILGLDATPLKHNAIDEHQKVTMLKVKIHRVT